MFELIMLIATGVLVGTASAFFGIGGGIVIIPALYFLFEQLPASSVIATSLGSIFINSLINNWNFHRRGQGVDKEHIIFIGISCAIGGLSGSYLVQFINDEYLKILFGSVLLLVAIKSILSKKIEITSSGNSPKKILFLITGFGGALLSSLTGLGGGAIFVPLYLTFVKLPGKRVSPYSNLSMSFATFTGLIPHLFYKQDFKDLPTWIGKFSIGNVAIPIIMFLFIGAFIGSPVGIRINGKISDKQKMNVLNIMILLISFKILFKSIFS